MLQVDVYKRLGDFELDVKFELDNEILVLFGPSGCGKSTTLELIAGLKEPDRGRIFNQDSTFFHKVGKDIKVNLPINRRRIGYVFQDYSLFPHMTAFENIAYGIQDSIYSEKKIEGKVDQLLSELRLKGLADHYPCELSGGQQQRVAIARALIVEPDILLLDEPFSALDTLVREKLRQDLLRVHAEFKIPIIYVTHNLTDVFELADKVAIYNEGKIEQFGSKDEVFYRPQTRNVARFVETKNIFDLVVSKCSDSTVEVKNDKLKLTVETKQDLNVGDKVIATIRPEFIDLLIEDSNFKGDNIYSGILRRELCKGAVTRLFINLFNQKDFDLIVDIPTLLAEKLKLNEEVLVNLPKESMHIII